ncbi:hypothetical protein [Rhodophyticola sp.]|uniref:hypothetical protein n=1 Tax=Rhodophyticola sp. TaxID=2680032 RepID=UPI003D265D81
MTASTDTTIVFLHIPKTAGQTIHSELARVVGAKAVSPVRVHTQAARGVAQMPPGYRLYSGHIDWEALDTLPGAAVRVHRAARPAGTHRVLLFLPAPPGRGPECRRACQA